MHRSEAGYSLAEMMVVLLLAGLMLTAMVATMKEAYPRWRLERSARAVGIALKGARAKAILEAANVNLTFDLLSGRYAVPWGPFPDATTVTTIGGEVLRVARLPSGIRFDRPDGTELATFSTGTVQAAVFDLRGMLKATNIPAYVYLGDGTKGTYVRLKVNLVGTVTLERWATGAWK